METLPTECVAERLDEPDQADGFRDGFVEYAEFSHSLGHKRSLTEELLTPQQPVTWTVRLRDSTPRVDIDRSVEVWRFSLHHAY